MAKENRILSHYRIIKSFSDKLEAESKRLGITKTEIVHSGLDLIFNKLKRIK